mgnify:CR=1 FL=1
MLVKVGNAVAVGTTELGGTLVGASITVGSRISAGIGVSVGVGSGVFNELRTLLAGGDVSGTSIASLMLIVRVPSIACPFRPSPQPMIAIKTTRMAKGLTGVLVVEILEI